MECCSWWSRSEGQADSVPVRAGGSGTSSWNRKILVDHQALARCKCHFSPIVVVCDLSFHDVFKVERRDGWAPPLPSPGALPRPTSFSPVVVWLDAPFLHLRLPSPDTAPEFSDCLERGCVDDHKSVNHDDCGILKW